jgi:DNA-binding MarR family transcriptional regulator
VAEGWLDQREAGVWRNYVVASEMLNTQLERDLLADSNLSLADYAVLVNLSEVDDRRLRATELASRMSWSRSRLSHQVGRMEARDLVKRESCGDDARGSYIVLTANGYTAIKSAAPEHVRSVRHHLLDNLTDAQIDALGEIASSVLEHLKELNELPHNADIEARIGVGLKEACPEHEVSLDGTTSGDIT